MKQAKSAVFVCLMVLVLIGTFAFGRHVRQSAAMPLRQVNALAARPAGHSAWTLVSSAGANTQTIDVPATQVASDGAGAGGDSGVGSLSGSESPLITFQQVYELLKEQYVNSIPSDTPLAHGAVSALIASLDDPNSRYMEPAERTAVDDQDKGVFEGAGIAFTVRKVKDDGLLERQITVIDPIFGSPAEKAGLKTGDVITDINGHWVVSYDPYAAQIKLFDSLKNDPVAFNHAVDATEAKIKDGLTLPKAQAMLDTTQTTPLVLSVTRNGQPIKITVDGSQCTTVNDVDSKVLADGNGYIEFHAFTDSTGADFQKAFAVVISTPGVVIDLRNCPGGAIDPAMTIAQEFAPNQPIGTVVVRDNHGTLDKALGVSVKSEPLAYVADASESAPPLSYGGHIVVLVDSGTANTAELLAAFLHDRLGARLVGTSTFGDGMAQTLFPMPDGSGFTLTTGQVKTSDDFAFEAKGITPDDVLTASEAGSDVALQRAEQDLLLKPLNASNSDTATKGQKS